MAYSGGSLLSGSPAFIPVPCRDHTSFSDTSPSPTDTVALCSGPSHSFRAHAERAGSHAQAASPSRRGRGPLVPAPSRARPAPSSPPATPPPGPHSPSSRGPGPLRRAPARGFTLCALIFFTIWSRDGCRVSEGRYRRRPLDPPPGMRSRRPRPPGTRPANPSPMDQPGPLAPGRKAALPSRPDRGRGEPWVAARPRNLQALAPARLQRRALRAGEAAVSGSRVCGRCDDLPRKGQVALRSGQHPPFSLCPGSHCPARLLAVPLTCRQPHLSTLQRPLLPSAQLPPPPPDPAGLVPEVSRSSAKCHPGGLPTNLEN